MPPRFSIEYRPKSLVAAVLVLSLLALFVGILIGNGNLVATAWPFVAIAGLVALAFIVLSLVRNVRSLR